MSIDIITKLIFSILESSMVVFLSLTLFRIPIRINLSKIYVISLIISAISIFQREIIADLEPYAFMTQIVCYIILIFFIFNLPFFFSILVAMIGYIAFVIIQMFLLGFLSYSRIATFESLNSSLLKFSYFQVLEIVVTSFIIIWLQKRKIGFMFISKRINLKKDMKGYNFFLALIIITSIIIMQFIAFSIDTNRPYLAILIGLTIIFIIGLIIAYIKNKMELKQKYERYNE